MPAIPNYYETLGVAEDAPAAEIKKAYRRLARDYHPDRNAGDEKAEERFKEVQAAYDTLGDADKRKQYDRMRRDPFAGRGADFGPGMSGGGRFYRAPDGTYVRVEPTGFGPDGGFAFNDDGPGDIGGLGDLFGRFFGGEREAAGGSPFGGFGGAPRERSAGHSAERGGDVESTLRLSFEEAVAGGKREVTLPSGDTVRITVPEAVERGTRVRLRGQGDPGPAGERGDLYLTYEVRPSARFERDGLDLTATETVNVAEAMLGTTRTIRNAYGEGIRVTIPAGTQPGERLRLRGQGLRRKDERGDLYVEIAVAVPKDLPDEAQADVRAWAERIGLLEPEAASEA